MTSTNVKKNDENFDVEENNKNQFDKFQKEKKTKMINVKLLLLKEILLHQLTKIRVAIHIA